MGILTGVNFSPGPRPAPTLTPIQSVVNTLTAGTQSLLRHMVAKRTEFYNLVWNNPNPACSPTLIAAALGTNLASTFAADVALVSLIVAQATANGVTLPASATEGVPSQWYVAFNSDGSGTITAKNG